METTQQARWTIDVWRGFALAVALGFPAFAASASGLSTSVMHPTPVGPTGVIEGSFPEGKTSFYVAVDVQPGELLTQIRFEGRLGVGKAVDLALLDANGRRVDGYWAHGEEPAEEKTRSFPIDTAGARTLRLEVEGPPTARYRVEIGGSALANAQPKATLQGALSPSVFAPTPVGDDGVIAGTLPGPAKRAVYYVALPVRPGDLLTQITVRSREGADKSLALELLQADARGGETYWVHGGAPAEEKTRSFPIDASGTQIIRLIVEGPETGTFQVEIGGSAVAPKTAAAADANVQARSIP